MTSKTLAKLMYGQMLKEISDLYISANKTLVKTYWQIGKRIVTIEQDGNLRAQYGASLLQNISDDLTAQLGRGFSLTNIKYMRQFYCKNPKGQLIDQLKWTQSVKLLSVKDAVKRKAIETKIIKNNLSFKEIKKEIRQAKDLKGKAATHSITLPKLLTRPKSLQLNTYVLADQSQITSFKDKIILDCGFFVFRVVSKKTITVEKSSYTYAAMCERVVDGDTLKVWIDIGFDNTVNARLRLRGINTPEMGTPEGISAKKFVQKQIKPGQTLIVKTHKTDLYGRFVADVLFLPEFMSNPSQIIESGVYLNNMLLEKGVAKTM